MNEVLVTGNSLPEAYHNALLALSREGHICPVSDYNTNQKELSMTMVVENPLAEPMISRCFIGGAHDLEQYRQEILDGILDFEIDRGNWDYTYHSRMAQQFDFILSELRRNPDSRRAVIDVRDWKVDSEKSSPACLQHLQYLIRDGRLHCKVLFRSNDATKASFMNAFSLIMLQKRFADELNVRIGTYTHRANSFHAYENDFSLLEGYVKRISSGSEVTYYYQGDWDAQMEDAKSSISEFVKQRRERTAE